MSTSTIDAAAPKETAPPPPAQTEQPKPVEVAAKPAEPAKVPEPKPEPAKAAEPPASGGVADLQAALDRQRAELDAQLAQVRAINTRHRERTILSTFARMGASGVADATLLMLVPASVDPETPAGVAALDKIREANPGIFRPQEPDTTAIVSATAKAAAAPQGYRGRYDDGYAERLARGVFERSKGATR